MKIDKVLIADDHAFVIEGVIAVLKEKFLIEEFILCTSPEDAVRYAKKKKPDLYILDLGFRSEKRANIDVRQLGYIKKISVIDPDAKIIIFSMREDFGVVSILHRIKQVKGIVFKGPSITYLIDAVGKVMGNDTYLCPRFTDLHQKHELYKKKAELKFANIETLPNDQKIKILELLSKGFLSKQIADMLGLSIHTVNSYRKDLQKYFHTYNTNDTIILALLLNHISLDDLTEDLLDRLD